jgi:hypothetical protein
MTYKVEYKPSNASQAWSTLGSYGSENSALAAAERIADRYFMVRVMADGYVVWSA